MELGIESQLGRPTVWLEPQMRSNYEITGFGWQSHVRFVRRMVTLESILSVFDRIVLLPFAGMMLIDPNAARVRHRA